MMDSDKIILLLQNAFKRTYGATMNICTAHLETPEEEHKQLAIWLATYWKSARIIV